MKITDAAGTYLEQKSGTFVWATALVIALIIGLVDYMTGYEIGLSVFYLGPIGLCVWFVGRKAGVWMSVLSTLMMAASMYLTGYVAGVHHRYYLADLWTLFLRFSFYLIVVLLLARLKESFDEQGRLVADLRKAFDEIKTLSGFLPICASCKKIRDDSGYWNEVEKYISDHSEAEFSHGLCPDCAEKLYPEYFHRRGRKVSGGGT